MPKSITRRPATQDDILKVSGALSEFTKGRKGPAYAETATFFQMTVESRVVGEAVVLQKWERGITEVELIHVPEVSRGQGYGKALMKEIEDFARTSGSATLRLNTVTFQGEGFYERCGMVEMGRVPLAALINGNRQYEITYWKDLSDSN